MTKEQFELLEELKFAVSDYLMGLKIPEFADEYGGIEKFLEKVRYVHDLYETQFNTLEEGEE